MGILKNAVDSISLGLEDYLAADSDSRRVLSCTRNIYAGILLLFKEKLRRLSPQESNECLIKKHILPTVSDNDSVVWTGTGNVTVDYHEIQKRFKSLGIHLEWKAVDAIRKYRNDIEHYFDNSSQSFSSIQTLVANCFVVIRLFVSQHLQEEPALLFGPEAWKTITTAAKDYEVKKKECLDHIAQVPWRVNDLKGAISEFTCPTCGSGLIDIYELVQDQSDVKLVCRDCEDSWELGDIKSSVIGAFFYWENYLSETEGDNPATGTCPRCGEETYILSEDICATCETVVPRNCWCCHQDIPPSELNEDGICGHCRYKLSKED